MPYNYENTRKYNVLYLLHGWTGCAEDFLNTTDQCLFKNILDNMIMNGDCSPFIVVSPTWDIDNQEKEWEESCDEIRRFWKEYVDCLIPCVETQYKTFYDKSDVSASRDHRAIGGFSLGGIATWYTLQNAFDYQKWYIPLSAECWFSNENEDNDPNDTIEKLVKHIQKVGDSFSINIGVGTRDNRLKYVNKQIDVMRKNPHIFTNENLRLYTKENGYHAYNTAYECLYNIIPCLF